MGYSPWGHKELDTTYHLHQATWLPGRHLVMSEVTFGFAVSWRGALLAGTQQREQRCCKPVQVSC